MKHLRAALRLLPAVLGVVLVAAPQSALADSALMTRSGVVYEGVVTTYGAVVAGAAGTADARLPVLALRTTRPGSSPVVELVDGTVTAEEKSAPSLGYDEITDTVFLVYTRYSGSYSDMHFAIRRAGTWVERSIRPSAGLYLSLNPQLLVTRQSYVDLDEHGAPIQKARSIVSIVWWEEGGRSQARYAPVFIEDGQLQIDAITAYNLNELAEAGGPTSIDDLPFSSYQFPAVQRDLHSSGGVLATFANLSTKRQTVLRISFPDDMQQIVASGVPAGPAAYVRIHTPIGRSGSDGRILREINVSGSVGTVVAPGSLVPTFFWSEGDTVHVLNGDSPEGAPSTVIPLRSDFSVDRAISVVREMALAN